MSRLKILSIIFVSLLSLSTQNAYPQQNNDEGLDEVCGLASGKWHKSASGWACCWSNWGCYGCTGGNCMMTCRTPRCKKANGMNKPSTNETRVNGLAPKGMKDPIVPKQKGKKQTPKSKIIKESTQ